MSEVLFQCVIPGRPGILKNSKKICRNKSTGRAFLKASDKYEIWAAMARLHILKSGQQQKIAIPINLKCVFYFVNHAYEPDLSNAYQGIEDLLQQCNVILQDKLIYSHDGSRKIFGSRNDRIEITITKFNEASNDIKGSNH